MKKKITEQILKRQPGFLNWILAKIVYGSVVMQNMYLWYPQNMSGMFISVVVMGEYGEFSVHFSFTFYGNYAILIKTC